VKLHSKYVEQAVDQLSSLPGIGKRTALRLVLQLLKRSEEEIEQFTQAFIALKKETKTCSSCGNLSDESTCSICSNEKRDHSIICVVEDIRDIMAIESTGSYKGIYHVLGGVISPMDGISPSDLSIAPLIEKVSTGNVIEIIFALSPTMEGDTTNFYLFKKLQGKEVLITTLSRGVSVGTELQFADEQTLSRSLIHRHPFKIN
jgi:recombination protein RecR